MCIDTHSNIFKQEKLDLQENTFSSEAKNFWCTIVAKISVKILKQTGFTRLFAICLKLIVLTSQM